MQTFRRTTEQDLPFIMDIIREVQENFRIAGIDQWQDGYPDEASFREDMQHGDSYVLLDGETVVATAMITFRGEPTYNQIEGAWLTNEPYAVIHRIAVSPSLRGKRLAERFFEEMILMCKEKEITRLRIDTHQENKAMQRLILRLNYTYCGIIYVRGGAPRLAYEREVGEAI